MSLLMSNYARGHYEEHFCEILLNIYQWFIRKCWEKRLLIWSSSVPYVCWSGTICAILVEGIMWNIYVNYCAFGPVVQEMSFKHISYLELWCPLCSAERSQTICAILAEHYEEHFCLIILNSDQWMRRRCHLNDFLFGALAALRLA